MPDEPRRVAAATHRLMESYKDDYPSHAKGILQEVIQNSVDARLTPGGFKALTITIEYDPGDRVLRIRDYGTTGMTHCDQCDWGIKKGTGEDCHEVDCRWGNFHYLGGLSKQSSELGSRGQGKSLLIVGGSEFVVRTRVVGDEDFSMASVWTRKGDEWYWTKEPSLKMSPDDKPGTELLVKGVVDELHEQLLDRKALQEDVSRTWFKVIERGATIRFGLKGRQFERIGTPRYPIQADPKSGVPTSKRRERIPVGVSHRIVGELEDISLYVASDPVPEDLRGIALIKNGTQVIERAQHWGRRIPPELQDRLFGWASYHCTDERPFLLKCERPGHRGFTPHVFYTKTLDLLQQQVDELLLPLVKQEFKPHLTERDRKRAQQNLTVLQKAFEENPDFNPWSGEGLVPRERAERPPPNTPYISEIKTDKDSYEVGDTATLNVVILNPREESFPFAHLTVEGLDDGLSPLAQVDLPPGQLQVLPPAHHGERGRLVANASLRITPDFAKGRNWVRCTLLNRPMPETTDSGGPADSARLDRKGHELWVGERPPARTHGPPVGGSTGTGKRPGSVQRLNPVSEGELDPVESEIMPFWDAGEFWFYTKGVRIGPVYDRQPRTADSILYELIAEAVAERVAQTRLDLDERDRLDKAQVLDEFKRVEDARRRFIRSCERFRSSVSEA